MKVLREPVVGKSLHFYKQLLAPYVEMVKGHIAKRDADLKSEENRYLRESKQTGYFVVDQKSKSTEFESAHEKVVAKIQSEFLEAVKLVKTMVTNMMGKGFKVLKVPMVQQQLFASTITTGVVNTTANITANNFVDFSTFALIFEEYRVVAGHYTFQATASAAFGASTPANTGPNFGVLSYSQVTSSLANVAAGWDDQQRTIIKMSSTQSGISDSLSNPQVFHYKIPPGVLSDPSTSFVGAGNWTLVADNTVIWGTLRPYCIVLSAAVISNAVAGINVVEMEFRMRL